MLKSAKNRKRFLLSLVGVEIFVLGSEETFSGFQDPQRCQARQRGTGHVQAALAQPSMLLNLIGALVLCWSFSIVRALHSHRALQRHLLPVSSAPRLLVSEWVVSVGLSSTLPHTRLTLILLQQFEKLLSWGFGVLQFYLGCIYSYLKLL